MATTYRPDIDGLRAVAIAPVVLFHADFDTFAGGFVGVDVFFVISGFLITSILVSEIEEERFSIVRFYERRCRRILPALFTVLVFTQIAGLFILLPEDYITLSKSIISTLIFGSNVFFWASSSDYFDLATETFPLLHTWSLAIEEQFYVVFPVALLILMKFGQRVTFYAIAALCLISFSAGVLTTRIDQSTAFYLAHTRAWELGIGSLLALWHGRWPTQIWLRESAAMGGAIAIGIAVLTYDDRTSFPGIAAAIPALGTAAIIAGGKGGATITGRILSIRPIVFVGLISYSLYLWHWPILAYLRVLTGDAEISPDMAVGAIILAGLLAVVSWAYVEAPFRQPQPIGFSRAAIFTSSVVTAAFVAGFAMLSWKQDGWPARFPDNVILAADSANDINPGREGCFGVWPGDELCSFPVANAGAEFVDFLLWGDSHADALMPGIAAAARDAGLNGLYAAKSACPPILGVIRFDKGGSHNCDGFNEAVVKLLRSRGDIPIVILAARWALAAEGHRPKAEKGEPALLARPGQEPNDPSGNLILFEEGLRATVEAIQETGREIILIGNVPEIGWNVPNALLEHARRGVPLPDSPTIEQVQMRQQNADRTLVELASKPTVHLVSVTDQLCSSVCRTHHEDGWAFYFDDDHLSARGARQIVAPVVHQLFARIIAERERGSSERLGQGK